MSDSEFIYQPNAWVGYSPVKTRPTPYEILLRQSRLLGRIAARSQGVSQNIVINGPASVPVGDAAAEQEFFQQNPDEIHRVVAQSQEILAGARTVVLPTNIFPDTVTIDRMKVTITIWKGLWWKEVVTLRIEDILNVSANIGLLFGSLTISTRVMNSTDHFVINGFWNKDAVRLKHIIQGYMIAIHEGIDVSQLSAERLVRKLNELGNDPSVVK